jgi:glucose-6-phosphate 1-dehydrogenase
VPQRLFDEPLPPRTNYLRFRLGPDRVAIALGARIKSAGESMVGHEIELYACNAQGDEMTPYERLLGDAMRGDATLFARQDSVEVAWEIVDRLLASGPQAEPYDSGSWGPASAERMVCRPMGPRHQRPVHCSPAGNAAAAGHRLHNRRVRGRGIGVADGILAPVA